MASKTGYKIECEECGATEFGDPDGDRDWDKEYHRMHHCPNASFTVTDLRTPEDSEQ